MGISTFKNSALWKFLRSTYGLLEIVNEPLFMKDTLAVNGRVVRVAFYFNKTISLISRPLTVGINFSRKQKRIEQVPDKNITQYRNSWRTESRKVGEGMFFPADDNITYASSAVSNLNQSAFATRVFRKIAEMSV